MTFKIPNFYKQSKQDAFAKTLNKPSPLFNTDPDNENNTVNTDFITDLAGDKKAVKREITKPGKKVEIIETDNEKYLKSFEPGFAKDPEGFDNIEDYRKNKETPYKDEKVIEKRDYSTETKPEYKIDENTGASYFMKPYKNNPRQFTREYVYPSYQTGHHEDPRHLVTTNEMLGNFRDKYGESESTNKRYEDWYLRFVGKPVSWSNEPYKRNDSGGGGKTEDMTNWVVEQ